VLEETYELCEAIAGRNVPKIEEELGDLLFMVLFLCRVGEEQGRFRFSNLVRTTIKKLRQRHPHVFKAKKRKSVDEVLSSWERTKSSVFTGIPRALPALQKAQTIQQRARRMNFEFKDLNGPLAKIKEEVTELEAELDGGAKRKIEEEMGDLLFSLVTLAGQLEFDAEGCLQRANDKFIRRFSAMERHMQKRGKAFGTATLAEMDESWKVAKGRSSKRAKDRSPRPKARS
jgi:MazG family protein